MANRYTVRVHGRDETSAYWARVSASSPEQAARKAKRRAEDDWYDDAGADYEVVEGHVHGAGLGFSSAAVYRSSASKLETEGA